MAGRAGAVFGRPPTWDGISDRTAEQAARPAPAAPTPAHSSNAPAGGIHRPRRFEPDLSDFDIWVVLAP